MARRTYGANQDMDSYRRSGRSAIQVQSHPRPYAPANHSQPPPHEPSEDGADNSPRRRIALACQRCRKRKIKCSGDEDGQGCGNCKAAGQEPGTCQFLRVNSTKCLVGDGGGSAWNFSTADPLISNTAMDRAGGSVGGFPMMTGTGGPRSSFGQGQLQNQGPLSIPNSFSASPTRNPESYLNLPNQDPWDTTIQMPAWQPNHDPMRSDSSNYQFMNHSALSGPSVMEGPSPFVAMGSGRTLPCPSSLTNQARILQPNSSIPANQGFLGESNPSSYPGYSPRSSQIDWGFRSNQVSTGLLSPSAIGTADRSSTKAPSDQVTRGNDLYGHLAPSAISPDTTSTRVSAGNLLESSNPASATLLRLQPNTSFPIGQSNDASPEFAYTHSSYPTRSNLSRSDNPLGSEGTIGGFELYSPLPQLQPAFQSTSRRLSNESLPAHRPATLMSSRS